MREHLDACPCCGGQWSTVEPSGKKYWPMLAGNITNDRVASWHCLHCGASWERGDTTISQPVLEGATDGPHE